MIYYFLLLPPAELTCCLQPWRAFKPDGVIMFSDILTPLTALGCEHSHRLFSPLCQGDSLGCRCRINFDVIKGDGPVISNPIRSVDDLKQLRPMEVRSCHILSLGAAAARAALADERVLSAANRTPRPACPSSGRRSRRLGALPFIWPESQRSLRAIGAAHPAPRG